MVTDGGVVNKVMYIFSVYLCFYNVVTYLKAGEGVVKGCKRPRRAGISIFIRSS